MNKIQNFFDTLKPRSVVVGVSLSALLSHQCSSLAVKPHNRGLNQGIDSKSATMEVVPLVTASSSSVQTGTKPALHQAVINGNRKEVERILKASTKELNTQDDTGRTAIHHALLARNGTFECIFSYKPDLNLKDQRGNTVLHEACNRIETDNEGHGDYMIIEELLERGDKQGANPDIPDAQGRVPLIKLIEKKAPYSVYRLVHAGADFDALEGNGRTAFHCVTNPRNLTFGHVSKEDIAALKKDKSVLENMVEFMTRDIDGAPAKRSQRNLPHISEFVNRQETKYGTVPLHWAATFSKTMLQILIEGNVGASVHKVDNSGNNALHYCVQHPIINSGVNGVRHPIMHSVLSFFDCDNTVTGRLQLLLDFMPGDFINHANKEGNTPLHLAVLTGQQDVYNFLIKKGALPTIKNKEGKSADDLRKEKGWK